jgi:hypothetical protein
MTPMLMPMLMPMPMPMTMPMTMTMMMTMMMTMTIIQMTMLMRTNHKVVGILPRIPLNPYPRRLPPDPCQCPP